MSAPGLGPRGELGRAFADLAEPGPPSTLSAAQVIAAAENQTGRRMRWVVGGGVAAAVIAVGTVIAVAVGNNSNTTSGSAAVSAASSRATSSAAAGGGRPAPSAAATSSRSGSAATSGPNQPAPPDGDSQAESGDCSPESALSSQQQQLLAEYLPDLGTPAITCIADYARLTYTEPGVTVRLFTGPPELVASGCPPQTAGLGCAPMDGHPDVSLIHTPSDEPVDRASSVTLNTGTADRAISLSVRSLDGSTPVPYPVERLAELVAALLAAS